MHTQESEAELGSATERLSVLLIEDEAADAEQVRRQLHQHGAERFELHHVSDMQRASAAVQEQRFDAILLDLGLPDSQGAASVDRIHETAPDTPIICLTGHDDEAAALSALRRGAQDYLVKGGYPPHALVNSLRFATERARLHRELEDSHERENTLKEKFLSHVSHEMRTPLTAIIQFVTILRDGLAGEVTPDQARYLDIVHRNSEQLKQMISTLMDATRCRHGKLRCVPTRARIEKVVHRALTDLRGRAEQKGVTLGHRVADGLPDAIADEGRIQQVLVNLIENGIKFTPAGGSVFVTVRSAPADVGRLEVLVDDTGCGVPEADLERVFDQLFQGEARDVSRKGLGLGLHISREILELHGGSIRCERRAKGGSRFAIELPAYLLDRHVERLLGCAGGCTQAGTGLVVLTIRATRGAARAKGIASWIEPAKQLLADCLDGDDDCVLPVRRFGRDHLAIAGLTPRGRSFVDQVRGRLTRQLTTHSLFRGSGARCEVNGWWIDVGTSGKSPGADVVARVTGRIGDLIEDLETGGDE